MNTNKMEIKSMMGFFENIGALQIRSEHFANHLLFEHYDAKYLGEQLLSGDLNCCLEQDETPITGELLVQCGIEDIDLYKVNE